MYKKRNKVQSYHQNLPQVIAAKFPSTCSETNKQIKKGEVCLYLPTEKKVYSSESNTYYNYTKQLDDEILGQGAYFA